MHRPRRNTTLLDYQAALNLIPPFQTSVGWIIPLAKVASVHRRVRKQRNGYG